MAARIFASALASLAVSLKNPRFSGEKRCFKYLDICNKVRPVIALRFVVGPHVRLRLRSEGLLGDSEDEGGAAELAGAVRDD
jgi:hypothetical protein